MSRIHFYLRSRLEEVRKRVLYESYEAKKLPAWERVGITWLALFAFWVVVSGKFSPPHLATGAVVTFIVALITRDFLTDDIRQTGHLLSKALYIFLFLIPQYLFIMAFRLLESNLRVVRNVILMDINPGIVKVKTDLHSNTGLTVLANSITLTPGTLTLDVDKKLGEAYLYVHWIDVETLDQEKMGMKIKGELEEWLKKIFW
ncbi:MAG: Na+/H+ antiporter subunit E [Thermococcus sp.]|uniref:Cation:proton antiporter n=1 Tax=Thermococcus guaymasensis DSM 11113 TaxID=1432656 RepID=A0A0X1KHU1_9EURY|nr:Na+/H+ antiporter subunit E [Thermococcus guaymasensis]AJC70818.1 cation:proton antiporter [Thermococcus guaymasensis DSM 11113]MCD6524607.1 Na+/H+ antiporter subunit E [Thermococcus sp.]